LTRERIERAYGDDKFGGNCHVIPNHAIIILSLLYSQDSFHPIWTFDHQNPPESRRFIKVFPEPTGSSPRPTAHALILGLVHRLISGRHTAVGDLADFQGASDEHTEIRT